MNKIFKYKNFIFKLQVDLNIKRRGGLTFHRVTISDMGIDNWFQTKEVEERWVVPTIYDFELLASKYVDDKDTRPQIIKELSHLGFK